MKSQSDLFLCFLLETVFDCYVVSQAASYNWASMESLARWQAVLSEHSHRGVESLSYDTPQADSSGYLRGLVGRVGGSPP